MSGQTSLNNEKIVTHTEKLVYNKKVTPTEKTYLWISRIIIWVSIIAIMFPVVAIISASLSKGSNFMQKELFPSEITFENYVKVIKDTDFLIWMKNSLFVCTLVATIQLLMTLPAAFVFSRIRFKGRKNGLMVLLLLQMFPASMAIPAILSVAYKLPWGMDNLWFYILVLCGGSAYNIWLMKGYIDGIPKDLDEAAMMDGATTWQTFTKIILPLTKSMLVVIFFFSFIGTFGEFMFSSALIKDPEKKTLIVGLKTFMNQGVSTSWTQYAAASVMATIPLSIIFVAIQKFVSKGLVAGAVKE